MSDLSSSEYGFSVMLKGGPWVAFGLSVLTCIGPARPMCTNSEADPGPPL